MFEQLIGFLLAILFGLVTLILLLFRAPFAVKDYLRYRRMRRMSSLGVS
ncbi:MAG TPA: hypothetical protein VKE74_05160 [Gemmataceae bacterium]|nr:hypothetical protein [Gemmataceae bacterium]